MASPTLRSSSTMVPLPSFRSWLTSIADLPSTAETVTGTSKTASRSCALRLMSASAEAPPVSNADEAPFIAFLKRDLGELSVQRLDHARVGAQDDTGLADRLVNGIAQCTLDISGGQGIQRDGNKLARHDERDLRRLFPDFLD